MARALRIERPGGRYHVTARGNERMLSAGEELTAWSVGWTTPNPGNIGREKAQKAQKTLICALLAPFRGYSVCITYYGLLRMSRLRVRLEALRSSLNHLLQI